jgi:hypothetical protein
MLDVFEASLVLLVFMVVALAMMAFAVRLARRHSPGAMPPPPRRVVPVPVTTSIQFRLASRARGSHA